jgi:predicted AlkP superfamily pyrophosphatase or phosphodiesterase
MIALLFQNLRNIEMIDSTNVIIVSDHGMTEVRQDKVVNIEPLIQDFEYTIYGSGPVAGITVPDESIDEAIEALKNSNSSYQVYRRENVPDYFHYSNHPFIPPIVLIADIGWSLVHNNAYQSVAVGGNHGYDNHHLDMHGIFYAIGPAFKTGYRTGTLRNIDIYPLLCEIFDIMPRQNVDGKLHRIEFILKSKQFTQ